MDLNSRVDHMDEELKLLKNEIKQVLLEVQEHVLNVQNPFSTASAYAYNAPAQATSSQPAPNYAPGGGAPTIIMDSSTRGGGEPQQAPSGGMGRSASDFPAEPAGASNPDFDRARPSSDRGPSPKEDVPRPREEPPDADDFISAAPSPDEDMEEFKETRPPRSEESRPSRDKREPAPRPRSEDRRLRPTQERERADALFSKMDIDYEDEAGPEFGDMEDERDTVTPRKRPSLEKTESAPDARQRRQRVMDLITLAGLAQWTQSVLRKVGRPHLESLLEVSERTGRIPKETREILVALIPLFEANTSEGGVTAKEIIALLAQLDGFLGTSSPADTKLLPFLLQDDLEVFPLIRP